MIALILLRREEHQPNNRRTNSAEVNERSNFELESKGISMSVNRHFGTTLRFMASAGGLALALGTAANAQTAGARQLPDEVGLAGKGAEDGAGGDIIVTATRRGVSLRDTPVAVAVQTGETLTKTNVTSFQDLTKIEPALVVNNRGASGNQFIIRGIQSDIGSTTGFYVDEAPLVGGGAVQLNGDGKPGLRLIDVERIEVLKGPQGTLFGAGSMAGTLRIITNKPRTDKYEAGVDLLGGSINGGNWLGSGSAYVNVPLGDRIAIRAVGWTEFGGGYIDQTVQNIARTTAARHDNVNDRTIVGGRVAVLLKPTDDFTINLQANRQNIDVDGLQAWDLSRGAYNSSAPSLGRYKERYQLYSATAEYNVDSIGVFTAVGSYGKQYSQNVSDVTPTTLGLASPFAFGGPPFNVKPLKAAFVTAQNFRDYTGELRFASKFAGPLQIVTGAFYENDQTKGTVDVVRPDDVTGQLPCYSIPECEAKGLRNPGFSSPGVPRSSVAFGRTIETHVRQWAVYGQADLSITDALIATAGIRYYHAKTSNYGVKIQDILRFPPTPANPSYLLNGLITVPYQIQNDVSTESSPTYNFSLLYKATPKVSLFARAASGVRIGGTNDIQTPISFGYTGVIPPSYSSDKLWSYELGVKASLFDGAVYIDTSIYQMNWTDQQLHATDPTKTFDFVVNAGKTRIRGAEMQVSYHTGGLSLNGGATYTDAKLTQDLGSLVVAAGTIGLKGDRVPRVPRWTLSGLAEYSAQAGNVGQAYIQGNVSYRSSSTFNFNNQNADNLPLPAFALVGAKIGVRTGPVDISLFVDNLTNKVAIYGLDIDTDGNRVYSPTPRTIGMRLSGRF